MADNWRTYINLYMSTLNSQLANDNPKGCGHWLPHKTLHHKMAASSDLF